MPKKIVIRAQINCDKCKTKALKIAAKTHGVNSLAIQGAYNNEVVVTGDDIDSATLACTLKKRLGYAEIVSVQEEKAPPKPQSKNPEPPTKIIPYHEQVVWDPLHYPPPYYELVVCEPNPNPCLLM